MKPVFTFLILCLTAHFVVAQKKAVTDNGVEVILNDDGTWKYANTEELDDSSSITTNPNKFFKAKTSAFSIKSKKNNFEYWIDPKKWTFKKPENNDDAEYELQLKEGDLYGMIISESIEIPLGTLKSIAIKNAKEVAPDLQIIKQEYRNVNGHRILFLQLDGTMSGVKISYYGYYFSEASGTTQFITYTSQNLLTKFKSSSEELLNGFSVMK